MVLPHLREFSNAFSNGLELRPYPHTFAQYMDCGLIVDWSWYHRESAKKLQVAPSSDTQNAARHVTIVYIRLDNTHIDRLWFDRNVLNMLCNMQSMSNKIITRQPFRCCTVCYISLQVYIHIDTFWCFITCYITPQSYSLVSNISPKGQQHSKLSDHTNQKVRGVCCDPFNCI